MEVDGDGGCQSAERAVRGNLVGLEVRLCLNDLFLADDGTTSSWSSNVEKRGSEHRRCAEGGKDKRQQHLGVQRPVQAIL